MVPDEDGAVRRLRVMNWSAGGRSAGSTTSPVVSATLHPEHHAELAGAVYLAPELRRDPASTEPTLDVFSLGALAYLLIAALPPASSSDELFESTRDGGLRLSASMEGTSQALDRLVAQATDANVSRRFATVDEFLKALDAVTSEESASEDLCAVPPDAMPGDRLAGDLVVRRRLGSGATAVAFLVERTQGTSGEPFVLKVARTPEQSDRIAREAAVLRELDHPHIPRLVEELELGAWRAFLTRPANDQTLRQRLSSEGPLQLELLERFGEQLLEALVHLEERGLHHRDIKPDNIAVTDFGRKQALGLVLFDFSLSGAPVDDLRVGTTAYSDPFLSDRPRRRWDLYAERYSAALTLHEMATGTLPAWGDAKSDPRATSDERIRLEPEAFPSDLRKGFVEFFVRALARTPADRFDNAASMRDAWGKVFQGTQHPPVVEAPADAAATLEERTRALGVRTPLHELPFSTRAANALDRLSLFTVEDLLRTPPGRLRQARGVGAKTRGELDETTRHLRLLFPEIEITAEAAQGHASKEVVPTPPEAFADRTVDEMLALLRPGPHTSQSHRDAFEALLGPHAALTVPTQTDAAKSLGISPQQLQSALVSLRRSWANAPAGAALVADLAAIVERHQGVLSFREAVDALLGLRGSAREGSDALAAAAAFVRIATDIEGQGEEPRWRLRRREQRVWLAQDDDLVRYAQALGDRALDLASQEPLPGRAVVESELTSVTCPPQVTPLPPGRLARLAVAAVPDQVDLSGRGELYPVGLPPDRALRLTVGALVGAGTMFPGDRGRRLVTIDEIRQRVHSRYPRAAELPDRPELDELLRAAGWEASWNDEHAAYVARVDDALTMVPSSTRWHRSRDSKRKVTPDDGFEERIRNALDARSFRVLKVHADDLEPAWLALEERFPALEPVDLDAEIASALRSFLTERGIDPETFFTADAGGPRGQGWGNVMKVMTAVLERVTHHLTASSEPLCLRNVGLLARYDVWTPVHALNPQVGARPGRATLVLLPGDVTKGWAEVGEKQLPVLPGQVTPVPDSWLEPFRSRAAAVH